MMEIMPVLWFLLLVLWAFMISRHADWSRQKIKEFEKRIKELEDKK